MKSFPGGPRRANAAQSIRLGEVPQRYDVSNSWPPNPDANIPSSHTTKAAKPQALKWKGFTWFAGAAIEHLMLLQYGLLETGKDRTLHQSQRGSHAPRLLTKPSKVAKIPVVRMESLTTCAGREPASGTSEFAA